jgi:hypothetical protein
LNLILTHNFRYLAQIKLPKTKAIEHEIVVTNNLNGDYKKDRELVSFDHISINR